MRPNKARDDDRADIIRRDMPVDWFELYGSTYEGLAELAVHLLRAYSETVGLAGKSTAAFAYLLSLARPGNVEHGTDAFLVWPSIPEIARASGCSIWWVPKLLHKLADAGLIVHPGNSVAANHKTFVLRVDPGNLRRPGRSRPSVIRLTLPTPVELFELLRDLPGDGRAAADLWSLLSRWHRRARSANRQHYRPLSIDPVGTVVVGPVPAGFETLEPCSESCSGDGSNRVVDYTVNHVVDYTVPDNLPAQMPQRSSSRERNSAASGASSIASAGRPAAVVHDTAPDSTQGTGSTPSGRAAARAILDTRLPRDGRDRRARRPGSPAVVREGLRVGRTTGDAGSAASVDADGPDGDPAPGPGSTP